LGRGSPFQQRFGLECARSGGHLAPLRADGVLFCQAFFYPSQLGVPATSSEAFSGSVLYLLVFRTRLNPFSTSFPLYGFLHGDATTLRGVEIDSLRALDRQVWVTYPYHGRSDISVRLPFFPPSGELASKHFLRRKFFSVSRNLFSFLLFPSYPPPKGPTFHKDWDVFAPVADHCENFSDFPFLQLP